MDKINKTTLFLILTFVISYSLVGIYIVFGGQYDNPVSATILSVAYMFIPMMCAILVKKGIYKEELKHNLLISFKINKWFFIAWLLPAIMSFGTLGISLLLPDVSYSPEMTGMVHRFEYMLSPEQLEQMKNASEALPIHPIWITLLQGLIAGVTINAIAGFGEELGWRGFLLNSFKKMNFLNASVIIGFIWGIWHSPLILMLRQE